MSFNEMNANDLDEVRHVDITVTAENLQDDLFKIYSQLFENIDREEVQYEEMTGGYVNSIIKLSIKSDKSKSLIFRTFGMKFNEGGFSKYFKDREQSAPNDENNNQVQNKKDPKSDSEDTNFAKIIFNRLNEHKVMSVISRHGLCEPVYAKYNNGICYGYTDGQVVNSALILTNDFLNEMATKLARFHSIKYEVPGIPYKTHFDRFILQKPSSKMMLLQIDQKLGDKLNEYPYNKLPLVEDLSIEKENIMILIEKLGFSRIVFAHNDINQKNIIWNPQKRTLGFIDFEFTMNNYTSFDIGRFFGFIPGHFLYDYDLELFPNIDYRRRFLRKYLQEFNKLNDIELSDQEFETELEDLLIKCDLSVLEFLLRQINLGKMCDNNPAIFNNEELKKRIESNKFFVIEWSIKVYDLYVALKDEILERAKKRLASKQGRETKF